MNYFNQTPEEFLSAPRRHLKRGEPTIRIQMNRNTLIAFVLSIVIHVLIILIALPNFSIDQSAPINHLPLQISLAKSKLAELPQESLPEQKYLPMPESLPKQVIKKIEKIPPKKVMTQKPILKTPATDFKVPKVLSENQPELAKEIPPTSPPVMPKAEAPTDMMSYIKSKRSQQPSEFDAAEQNAAAATRERVPSEEEKRNQRIKQNFQNGTNGIFEITNLSSRYGSFAFRGWTNDYSNARQQFFEVEAKSGQDIRLIMIRRMISLIREHYQGDFNWQSYRLGRTVSLSARLEDSEGLEDFIMTEFFGPNYKNN